MLTECQFVCRTRASKRSGHFRTVSALPAAQYGHWRRGPNGGFQRPKLRGRGPPRRLGPFAPVYHGPIAKALRAFPFEHTRELGGVFCQVNNDILPRSLADMIKRAVGNQVLGCD